MKTQKHFVPSLTLCIFLDLVGMFTYTIPLLGEFADLIWAPISAMLFYNLFGGRVGLIGGVLNFAEELIPFTDIIPSFTIAWFIRKSAIDKLYVRNAR